MLTILGSLENTSLQWDRGHHVSLRGSILFFLGKCAVGFLLSLVLQLPSKPISFHNARSRYTYPVSVIAQVHLTDL